MSTEIFQQYKGQSFDKAIARFLRGTIIASGFEPRDRASTGRFWWGLLQDPDEAITVVCGRVSNFQDGGWGYKIERATAWENKVSNPPLNVRKAIVKHGLRVKGVYNPDSDDHKFALMMRETMVASVSDAILSGDDAFLLEAIAYLGSDAANAAMDFFFDQCGYVSRKPPKVSTTILRAIAANADQETAKWLMIVMRDNYVQLDATVADTIYPLLKESSQKQLAEMFPHMSAQQAA